MSDFCPALPGKLSIVIYFTCSLFEIGFGLSDVTVACGVNALSFGRNGDQYQQVKIPDMPS
jgi:hypothetical protein